MKIGTYGTHPACDIFPLMGEAELAELAADIKAHGLLDPIVLHEGKILDGRNRLLACERAGIEPRFMTWSEDSSPWDFVWSRNAERRHLDKGQQVAVKILALQGDEAWRTERAEAKRQADEARRAASLTRPRNEAGTFAPNQSFAPVQNTGPTPIPKTKAPPVEPPPKPAHAHVALAAAAGVSTRTAADALSLQKKAPERLAAVARGDVTLKEAVSQAKKEERIARLAEQAQEPRQATLDEDGADPAPSPVTIHCCDSRRLPLADESVHLVVTSPPYNVGMAYRAYTDRESLRDYLAMLSGVLFECRRVLVPGGRICVNVPHTTDRDPAWPIGAHVTLELAQLFGYLGTILWDKGSSGNRTSWGSFRLPSAPCLRDTCELVIIGAKPGRFVVPEDVLDEDAKGKHSPWLKDAELFLSLAQDHWSVRPEPSHDLHPAPFPVELPERLIRFYGFPGCTVLDPFGGSGTTGVAAVKLGAKAVLVDMDESYCAIARRRCEEAAKR